MYNGYPFTNTGNKYCSTCEMAIQVCIASADATCVLFGLPAKGSSDMMPNALLQKQKLHTIFCVLSITLSPAFIHSNRICTSCVEVHKYQAI